MDNLTGKKIMVQLKLNVNQTWNNLLIHIHVEVITAPNPEGTRSLRVFRNWTLDPAG